MSPSVPDSQRFLPFLAVENSWNMLKATEPFDAPQGKLEWNNIRLALLTQASPIRIHAPHVGVFMLPIKQ